MAGTRVTATLPIATAAERVVVDRAAVSSAYPLSGKTVSNHISNVFAKLHVADRAQAIVTARGVGLGRGLGRS